MPLRSSSTVDANIWLVQAGITKNWFGLGNTSFYGEYGRAKDYIQSGPANSTTLYANPTLAGILAAGIPQVDFYGIGVVQQIDAAAMELYLGWRRYETEISGTRCRHSRVRKVRATSISYRRCPRPVLIRPGLTLHDSEEPPHRAALFAFVGRGTSTKAALPLATTQC